DRLGGGLDGSVDARLVLTVRTAADLDAALAVLDSLDMIALGTTSVASVRASMDDIADARTAASVHLNTAADMLLGFAAPLDAPTGASALAAAGSATVGAGG
ncbi:MAG TPA: hypothetical protein PKA74_08950, partial [Bauldia sp.]|nr:hypothetical protein [Bauldia sp.]